MKKILPILVTLALIVLFFQGISKKDPFDPLQYHITNVVQTIETLSSKSFEGRKTGTEGNRLAMALISSEFQKMGVETFEQPFVAQIPSFDEASQFSFLDDSGNLYNGSAFENYRFIAWGPGGSIDYQGDLVFVDNNPYHLPEGVMTGKVVVLEAHPQIGDSLQTIIDAGAVGILYYPSTGIPDLESFLKMQSLECGEKPGNTIGLGFINRDVYLKLKNAARLSPIEPAESIPAVTIYGTVKGATIRQKITFETVDTANVIGILEGKNSEEVVIVSSTIDHVGAMGGTKFFPGAVDNASSVAIMLEIAHTMNTQSIDSNKIPDKTMVFAALNASENGQQGIDVLIQSLVSEKGYQTQNIQVIELDSLGGVEAEEVILYGSGEPAFIPISKISRIASDLGIELKTSRFLELSGQKYASLGIPVITVSHFYERSHLINDDITSVSEDTLNKDMLLIMHYLESIVYTQNPWQVLTQNEVLIIAILAFYLFLLYGIEQFKETSPFIKKIYYSTFIQLAKRISTLLTPIVILILLVVITKLPRDMDIAMVGGALDTNFSTVLTFKHTMEFIRSVLSDGIGNLDFVKNAFFKSSLLFVTATFMALVFGVLKGMFDAYSDKENSELRSFVSITALSVPDIMWILLSNYFIVLINKFVEFEALRGFVFPLLTLTIMPMIYISRMSYLAFNRERQKPYYMALKSRGISKFRIFTGHLLLPVLENAFTSMLGLTSVMISNLIIIEYLFDYKGLASFVLIADKTKDEVTFISLIAAISVLYLLLTALLRGLLYLTTARRKGGTRHV